MSLFNDIKFFAEDGTAGVQYKNFLVEMGIGRLLFGIAYNGIGISLYLALVTVSFFFGSDGDEVDE